MSQFYCDAQLSEGKEFSFDEKESAHLKVFRVKKGEKIKVFSPWGRYIAEISDFRERKVIARVLAKLPEGKKDFKIKLYFSFIEKSAFEEVFRKGTETGCDIFIPLICEYTQKNHILDMEEKMERFNEIIFSSVKQCERSDIPQIAPPVKFNEIFVLEKRPIIFSKTDAHGLPAQPVSSLRVQQEAALVIGPEGGFSPSEISLANGRADFISLGQNVLRSQTAAALACAILRALK
ncbi:MAG: 16S rRNA (uracil(1498)-N(3))-methyltransferase [Elusimicrobiota bacterium]